MSMCKLRQDHWLDLLTHKKLIWQVLILDTDYCCGMVLCIWLYGGWLGCYYYCECS